MRAPVAAGAMNDECAGQSSLLAAYCDESLMNPHAFARRDRGRQSGDGDRKARRGEGTACSQKTVARPSYGARGSTDIARMLARRAPEARSTPC